MNSKVFSQRFNRELALMGFPDELTEKIKAVSKVFGVTRHLANSMIFGHLLPNGRARVHLLFSHSNTFFLYNP